MEAAVVQCSVDKKCFEIQKKELLLKNDRLLELIISQDRVHTGVNSLEVTDECERMKCSTSASGLKPRCNTMENRISTKQNVLKANSKSLCKTCNKCLFNACDDECVVDYLMNVNKRAKSRSAKSNKKNDWKPTIKVFTSVGYTWLPTGRTFTKDGIKCPMTKITSTKVVPPKETSPIHVITKHPDIKVNSRRPKLTKSVSSSNEPSILGPRPSNNSNPTKIGCSKHMIGKHSQLINFDHKFLGTVRFGNDQIAKIIRYGDYQIENVTISRVYYVEGLGHNLFFVGSRDTNLYIDDIAQSSPICLLSKASKTKSYEDLAKLKPKADIGIFIGYAPAKKAYRIYNRRTRLIMETIHVNFNELTAMASEQFGLGPTLHEMTPGTISSGLYFTPPLSVVSHRLPPIIPQAGDTTGTPLSTFVEQDAPAASTSSTTQETQSPVIHDGVEE
ncbi:hypothetical protein Tco_0978527 [Tanacetum coccineum]|uniref:Integrase, catalytic region, zinc finger, CCHC-type, peptidase aspartic, catalytic n=1 Tax=Tanacetum coccineum TaxID=301880 RepID=A0ABQ5ENB7_9ASTR